jgi:hypothetical protein
MMKILSLFSLFLLTFLTIYPQEIQGNGWYLEQSLSGELNPLGLLLDTKLCYEFPLIRSEDLLFKTSRIDVGVIDRFSPAFNAIGFAGYIEPIAFFDCTVYGTYQYCYNAFGYGFLPEANPAVDFSPAAMANAVTLNQAGWWVVAAPELRAEEWNIIIDDTYYINYMDKFNFSGYYYESYADIIINGNNYYFINDGYLLYDIKPFMFGINYYNLNVPSTEYVSQRLSAVAAFVPDLKPFNNLSASIFIGTYLQDHYYVGKLFLLVNLDYKLKVF